MRLLTFAHRGEAQTFLREYKLKADSNIQNLYIGESSSILITGEGIYETMVALTSALTHLKNVTEVINLGICGSLATKHKLNSILPIRTIYSDTEFKSFTTNSVGGIDLVTTSKRVLNKEEALSLSVHAELVDREAWANGLVCKKLNKNFKCIKLVSDHISEAQFCEVIKDNAEFYSNELYEYLEKEENKSQANIEILKLYENENLYFTVSQKRQYKNILSSLKAKLSLNEDEIHKKVNLELLQEKDILPKERTKILLKDLDILLYPFKAKITNSLNMLFEKINKHKNIDCRYDKNLEQKTISLNTKIESEQDIDTLKRALKDLSWEDFSKVMDGDL